MAQIKWLDKPKDVLVLREQRELTSVLTPIENAMASGLRISDAERELCRKYNPQLLFLGGDGE